MYFDLFELVYFELVYFELFELVYFELVHFEFVYFELFAMIVFFHVVIFTCFFRNVEVTVLPRGGRCKKWTSVVVGQRYGRPTDQGQGTLGTLGGLVCGADCQ